ncbi:MAG TPA: ATP-binding protein [Bacillota bacterium]|nr:ATP-binding protein [Bacillota bacterium]HPT35043.1 ATP-binding protein [Bacillota bacterium]
MKSRYLLVQKAEAALIEEKAEKLFGITRLLDSYLKGSFHDIVRDGTREDQIAALNHALTPFVDMVVACYRGVGAGYYSKKLRAIVAYGPSERFGSKVEMDLGQDHLGWQAMASGKETVGIGSMVRGEIMNCMRPLIREGEAIGFVWANETLEDVYSQIRMGARDVFFSDNIEPLLGLTGLLLFASQVLLFKNENAGQGQSDIIPGLERLERYLKLFLDSLSLAVILVGHDERISFASSGIKDILGVPPEALISQPVREVLQRFGIDPHFALDDATRGAKNRFVNVPVHVDGVEKLVTMVTTGVTMPHWAGHGTDVPETYGHIIILEDLREARAQEERLERIERLATVGELAAAIAHEVRNPLTVVKGAVSLLPQRLDDPDFLGKFQGIVTQEVDRIDRTIDSLLNFARFSQPKMARINVIPILKRACDLISPYAKINKTMVETHWPDSVPDVMADPEHLIQAFMNLFLNGIQAMPQGGTLKVKAQWVPGSKYITISVEDTGIGMPPEHIPRIFDMFFTTRKGGTGLGLPLVQRIIYEHQGFLEVDSALGKGSCFWIRLPVASGNE